MAAVARAAAPARSPAPAAQTAPAPRTRSSAPTQGGTGRSPARGAVGRPALQLAAPAGLSAEIAQAIQTPTGGEPLPKPVQAALEGSLGVALGSVRVHSDPRTAQAVQGLGARAFTYGAHIFLGPGERATDLALMAHEATHVIQQRGGPVLQMAGSGAADTFEREAQQTSAAVQRGGAASVRERTGGPRVQASWVGDLADRFLDFSESVGWRLLEELAPELVPIFRQGPVEWLRERIGEVMENVTSALAGPVRAVTGVAAALRGHFTNLVTWIREAGARIARNDCGPLREAAEKIQQVFEGLAAPVVERLRALVDRVKGFFSDIWDRFGAPVWQFLQRVGGAIWTRVQQVGRWIWEKLEPVRRRVATAWTWVKNKLGIGEGPEGQDGILQWFQRKAQWVWDQYIAPFYERFRRPILIVGATLVMLSPAGPVIAIGAAIAGVAAGIRAIRQFMADPNSIVNQRNALERTIIPGIVGGVNRVASFLSEKAQFIADKLTGIVANLNGAVGSIAGSILNFAVSILQWLLDQFRELVTWATAQLLALAGLVRSGLERLQAFLQPVLDFLRRIGRVVAAPMRLVYELGARVWNAIPACIRDPFIDFFIPLILRQIAFFRELGASPEAWQQTRAEITTLIRQVFIDWDLLGAMRTAFGIFVRAMRIPVNLVVQLLNKAAQAWDAVLAAPLRFIENAFKAILMGIGRFMRNILSHLWFGVQGWLLNSLTQAGISPPQSFTLQGVFGFVLDVMGISINHVIDLINRRVPGAGPVLRGAVRLFTRALEWLRVALDEGPRGLWRHLVDQLSNLGTVVLESAVNWVMTRIIANVSLRLTALAASAGLSSVLEAVKAIYSAIQTAIEFMTPILQILIRAFDTVIQIAAGNLSPAAELLETGLRMAMPVVIGFLANYANLGGIGQRIREVVLDIRTRVDNALLRLIDGAIGAIRAVINAVRSGVRAVLNWWNERRQVPLGDGQVHTLRFRRSGQTAQLLLASVEKRLIEHLDEAINGSELNAAEKGRAREARDFYNANIAPIADQPVADTPTPAQQAKIDALPNNLNLLSGKLAAISPENALALPQARWNPGGPQGSTVETLSNRTSRGGEDASSGNPAGWSLIVSRGLTRRNGNWVRMHMITAGIGGQDVNGNLLPAPTAINTGSVVRGFETQVERILYGNIPASAVRTGTIFKRLAQRNAVIWVETTSQGFWPEYKEPGAQQPLYNGNTFATGVFFKAGMHYQRDNNWAKDPAILVQAQVSIPQPDFSGSYQPNINEIGEPTIANLAEINPHVAREIIEERDGTPARSPHRNAPQFISRMRAYRQRQGVAYTPGFDSALNAVVAAVVAGRMKWQ